jgi:uncharacterized membrane protein
MEAIPRTFRDKKGLAILLILMFILPLGMGMIQPSEFASIPSPASTGSGEDAPVQPWPQYMGSSNKNGSMPAHAPGGGPGQGEVGNVTVLGTVDDPVVNWVGSEDGGTTPYGSLILDLSANIQRPESASQRCAEGDMFALVIDSSDGTDHTMRLIAGDDAKIAWEVNLGASETIRSTPVVADIDADGDVEIVVSKDTSSGLDVQAWSPDLECDASGWVRTGHSNERLWTWSDADYSLSAPSPHLPSSQTGHRAVTQPLLEDVDLDGVNDLVLAVVDQTTDDPTLLALPLDGSSPSAPLWEVALDRGTHPSDPTAVRIDGSNVDVVVTTIDASSGAMWAWKVDGGTGALDWERAPIPGTDSDQDAPRLRLPGPVIVQLDGDAEPEVILTVPTDPNGRTTGSGARFVAMELTSTTEIFSFRAPNGYADAPPLPIDTDDDGIHDRLCWVTWYSSSATSFNRQGMAGCHDISDDPPVKEWSRTMERGSGTDNDEIAVAPPLWVDVDGDGPAELLVAFGRRLHCFDGETGAPTDVSTPWEDPVPLPHRTWAAPAVADMDGDGHLDVLIGDMLVSQRQSDIAVLSDGRALLFTPEDPDPGEAYTVSARFENVGTEAALDNVDAVLIQDGEVISRHRLDDLEPIDPSGDGTTASFSVGLIASLGISQFTLVLDPNDNLTEAREDNNVANTNLEVRPPHAVDLSGPVDTPNVSPGTSERIEVDVMSTGTREATWQAAWTDDDLPSGWSLTFVSSSTQITLASGASTTLAWDLNVPITALGDEEGWFDVTVERVNDPQSNASVRIPVEVLRTRGLDMEGPDGTASTNGLGRPGQTATAWFSIENLGNAAETTTSIDWSTSTWGAPRVENQQGQEQYTLTLEPDEFRMLRASVDVPQATSYGQSITVVLTVCIGEGSDELCRDLDVMFAASRTTVEPPHQRTFPNTTVDYTVQSELPNSGVLQWNSTPFAALPNTWTTSVVGASLNATILEATGAPNSIATFVVRVTMPSNAPPQRHAWTLATNDVTSGDLSLSLHVLQRNDVALSLVSPASTEDVTVLEVGESEDMTVRLSNPGNDADTYSFTAMLEPAPASGNVSWSTPTPIKNVAQGGSSFLTMAVMLDGDVPAMEPFGIRLTATSLQNQSVSDSVLVPVAAAPDRSWSLNTSLLPSTVLPDTTIEVNLTAENLGNAPDNFSLRVRHVVDHVEGDLSVWPTSVLESGVVPVGSATTVQASLSVPQDAWNGTVVTLHLEAMWEDQVLANLSHAMTVARASGWAVNLTGVDLVVPPGGGNITVPLLHLGNSPQDPWFSKIAEGWPVSFPENGTHVEPFGTSSVTINVMPPNATEAGDVGTLNLRISNGDGAGSSQHQIPVRMSAEAAISYGIEGPWMVSNDGGMPTVWIRNDGNDLSTLELALSGLPEGWNTTGTMRMVLAPGDVQGLPMSIVPAPTWDGTGRLVTLTINHPRLDPVDVSLEIRQASTAFASSPVVVGVTGGTATVDLTDGTALLHTITQGEYGVNIGGDGLKLHQFGQAPSSVSLTCSVEAAPEGFGRTSFSGAMWQCEGTSTTTERVTWSAMTSDGQTVPLSDSSRMISDNGTEVWTINASSWSPSPGRATVTLTVHDSRGVHVEERTWQATARAAGWNLGIETFEIGSGVATVGVRRQGVDVLGETVCSLTFSEGTTSRAILIDVTGAFAPSLAVDLTDLGFEEDALLTAEVRCDLPFDIDDDPQDDTATAIYRGPSPLDLGAQGWLWALMALLVVGVGGRFFLPRVAGSSALSSSNKQTSAAKDAKSSSPSEPTVKNAAPEPVVSMLEESATESPEATSEDVAVEEEAVEEDISVSEEGASGRLADLRRELDGNGDAPRPSLEERMSRFFDK